ncbi:MAG: TIGR03000 domain-containing protein, partial [Planctomycetales bacterium]|nr:TIGR03000 domain-containing protein [Planctomycetales bacterium]
SSYSSWGSSGGSSGGSVYYSSPAVEAPMYEPSYSSPAPASEPPALPAPAGTQTSTTGDATLTVNVPSAAKIYVNGRPTTSEGDFRRYVSRGLSTGYDYTYEVRAEVERDGKKLEETKVVTLRGGQALHLDFALTSESAPVTSLTVNVPEDAKLYLSGVETSVTGSVRTFTTSKLAAGTVWSDYVVKVEVNRDGRTIVDEKSISLTAGDTKELTFTLDAVQVADAR